MKNILSILFILLLSVTVFAQNPKLSYQSVVRDSENKLVVEQPITVTMNVLDAAGNSQFEQTLNATTNRNGLVSLEFGDETAAWNNIDWNGAKIRTAVAYDGNEMVDTAVVNAVPFALYANTVNTAAIPQSDWAETDNTKCTFILNKPSIADTVNNILTAGNYVTTTMMDARGYLTSDSAVITTMQTNIASNTTNITANTNAIESLANRVNTFNTNVCDSVTTCINNAIDARGYLTSDSAVITTMQTNIASNTAGVATNADKIATNTSNITTNANAIESLANRVNTFNTNVCDSVTTCINNAMDARGYLTSDSTVITTMQTSIASNTANIATNAGNIAANASNITTNANAIAAAVGKEKADSTTLAGRITALESATMNCNDVKACIADTLSKYTTTDQLCNVVSTCDFSTNASLQNMLNELSSKLSATQTKLDSLSHSIDSIADIDPSHDGPAPRPFLCGDSLADHEGNMYKTMIINNRCWMAENLRCTTSPSTRTSILENPANSISYSGKKAYYVEGDAANTARYGLLYNWCAAVDTFNTALGETSTNTNADNAVSATFYGHRRGICPEGWHLPTKNEWKQMGDYVAMQPQYNSQEGFYDNAKALSSKEGWSEDLSIAYDSPEQFWSPVHHPERNNATGFSAYPAGYYGINYGLRYNEFGVGVFFWTSNENTKSTATTENISFVSPNLGHVELSKSDGCSVRCLRDYLTVLINDIQKTDSTASSLSIRAVCKVTKPITSATISAYTDSACTNLAGTCTPSISYSSTSLGADLTGVITGLTTVNQYWIRVTATTENDTTAREAGPFKLLDEVFTECGTSRVTDPDGNKYSTVQIGDQCWMAENLRTTVGLTENSDYWHANGQDTNDLKYGLLYNWAAVMQGDASSATNPSGVQGICPEGWHVPSEAEWDALTTAVGSNDAYKCDGNNNIARALASTFGWTANDTYVCTPVEAPSSNNATGFAAAPTGYFLSDPTNTHYGFNDFRYAANFWSTTDNDDKANVFFISGYVKFPSISEYSKTDGYSVRCVRNEELPESGTKDTITFIPNGGMGTMSPMMVAPESNIALTANTFAHDGNWQFIGWNTAADGSGDSFLDEQVLTSEGNLTLYAQWHTWCTGTPNTHINEIGTDRIEYLEDNQNNRYQVVQIGNQCWMRENLRTTKYADATDIEQGSTTSDSVAYWYYPNDNADNKQTCGLLYNWKAVRNGAEPFVSYPKGMQGICPTGWHVPSKAEWTQMTDSLKAHSEYGCGNNDKIAKALASPQGWNTNQQSCKVGTDPYTNNASGFSAIPAGSYTGSYSYFGDRAYFWTSDQNGSNKAFYRSLYSYLDTLYRGAGAAFSNAYSVRCVRDMVTPDGPETENCGTVIDQDGNTYRTVIIGEQCWMRDNLRTLTNNGYGNVYTPTSKQIYGYDAEIYGRLYDWAAVMQGAANSNDVPSGVQGICPTGWHVPSDAEWIEMIDFVKSQSEYRCDVNIDTTIAKALASTKGWYNSPNNCTVGHLPSENNAVGFSAIPAGYYSNNILYTAYDQANYATTSKANGTNEIWCRTFGSNGSKVYHVIGSTNKCYSVRCVKN